MAESTGPGGRRKPVLPPRSAEETSEEEAAAAKEAERKARAEEKERARQERVAERERKAAERAEAKAERERAREEQPAQRTAAMPAVAGATSATGSGSSASRSTSKAAAPRRQQRRAQLRLTQVDAWSVMKTSFLLSIALGIVLVVAVSIIWAVLGAAGVWESINTIVQQSVGNADGPQFDITDYVGTSRVLGLTMIVAVVDVVLITAIATLGAFLYNLSAALLGGIEVTLAEDN